MTDMTDMPSTVTMRIGRTANSRARAVGHVGHVGHVGSNSFSSPPFRAFKGKAVVDARPFPGAKIFAGQDVAADAGIGVVLKPPSDVVLIVFEHSVAICARLPVDFLKHGLI